MTLFNSLLSTPPIMVLVAIIGLIGLFSTLVAISASGAIERLIGLVAVFLSVASLFWLFDFYFLALTYIIVYVGAIAVLFLFVIMMIPVGS